MSSCIFWPESTLFADMFAIWCHPMSLAHCSASWQFGFSCQREAPEDLRAGCMDRISEIMQAVNGLGVPD